VALGLEERKAHRAADEQAVGLVEEGLDDTDLVRHLRAAEHGDQGPLRGVEQLAQRRHLALEQPPRGGREQARDRLRRRVGPVRRAERVVDVDVGERRVAAGEALVVLGLAGIEADVLEHDQLALGHRVEVGGDRHVRAEQRAQALGHRTQGELRIPSLRPPQVRGEHEPRALAPKLLDRGKGGADARVVGDRPVLAERHVEVRPDEDALGADVELIERPHYRIFWASSTQRLE
jgi:hypothetical protein